MTGEFKLNVASKILRLRGLDKKNEIDTISFFSSYLSNGVTFVVT